MRKPKILVVGSFVLDMIATTAKFPEAGETILGIAFQTAPGGKGANQAAQAAKLGADVSMFGKVGTDNNGTELLNSAKETSIDVSMVLRDPNHPSAVASIQIEIQEGHTQNRILVISGANMAITEKETECLKEIIAQYDMVMLQLEIPMAINEQVAQYAFDLGIPVMLNSAPSAPLSDKLLSHLTYISPNEYEAADITGVSIQRENNALDQAHVKQAVDVLLTKGVKNVVITLGDEGAIVSDGDSFLHEPCVYVPEVKDPTAAGDSFVSAFCTAICCGLTHEHALIFANHVAAITVSRMGAQPSLPTLDEVITAMKTHGITDFPFEQLNILH